MRLFSVAGACSRAGKTAAAASLLRHVGQPAASAVKFTTTEDVWQRCPRGTACVVCDIAVPFRLVEDPALLRQPGTDTARLWAAGARRVLWAIARRSAAAEAWQAVQERLAQEQRVVMEGSTIVELARPELLVFVVQPFLSPSRWKPTTPGLLRVADVVVINRPAGEPREPAAEVLEAVARARGRRSLLVADVTRPPREWAPELAQALALPGRPPAQDIEQSHAHLPRP